MHIMIICLGYTIAEAKKVVNNCTTIVNFSLFVEDLSKLFH